MKIFCVLSLMFYLLLVSCCTIGAITDHVDNYNNCKGVTAQQQLDLNNLGRLFGIAVLFAFSIVPVSYLIKSSDRSVN